MTLHQSELTKQQIAYKAVRQRVWNSPWKPKAPEATKIAVVQKPRPLQPAWKEQETPFDAHIQQYKLRLVEIACNPATVHIKDRCHELGLSYAAIIGQGRRAEIVIFRQLFMWEIQQKFGLSYPAIGRLFGGRDHTTALWGIRKIEKMKAAGSI
jgi:hypothetical protein